jgi:hypothetical protein
MLSGSLNLGAVFCANRVRDVIPDGEMLVYEVRWNPPGWMFFVPTIKAGEMTLRFEYLKSGVGELLGYRISAKAVSSGLLPKVTGISIEDSFESLVSGVAFCSTRMTKNISEGNRHRKIILTFDSESGSGRFQMYDTSKTPPLEVKNETVKDVPACVRDLLSAIYVTRLWDLKPDARRSLAVSDDGTVRLLEVRVHKRELVQTSAGHFPALKLETSSGLGGMFKGGGTFLLWLSDDERKLPVRFEAKVKLGRVFGSVKQVRLSNEPPTRVDEQQRVPTK